MYFLRPDVDQCPFPSQPRSQPSHKARGFSCEGHIRAGSRAPADGKQSSESSSEDEKLKAAQVKVAKPPSTAEESSNDSSSEEEALDAERGRGRAAEQYHETATKCNFSS